jgi:hypothetical protein
MAPRRYQPVNRRLTLVRAITVKAFAKRVKLQI